MLGGERSPTKTAKRRPQKSAGRKTARVRVACLNPLQNPGNVEPCCSSTSSSATGGGFLKKGPDSSSSSSLWYTMHNTSSWYQTLNASSSPRQRARESSHQQRMPGEPDLSSACPLKRVVRRLPKNGAIKPLGGRRNQQVSITTHAVLKGRPPGSSIVDRLYIAIHSYHLSASACLHH